MREPKYPTLVLRAVLHYNSDFGWHMFPARMKRGKKYSWLSKAHAPEKLNWGMSADPDQLIRNFSNPVWRDKCGIGLPTGAINRIFVVEFDTPQGHGVDGAASLQRMESEHGSLPLTLMAQSPTGSVHRFFRHPGEGFKVKSTDSIAGYSGVDVKGDGGFVAIPPSPREDGVYQWLNDEEIAPAPQWLLDLVCDVAPLVIEPDDTDPFVAFSREQYESATFEEVAAALQALPNEDVGWDEWNRVGMAIYSNSPNADGFNLFDWWSQKSSKYSKRDTQEKWRRFRTSPPSQIHIGTLFYLADEINIDWRDQIEQEKPQPVQSNGHDKTATAAKPLTPSTLVAISTIELMQQPVEAPTWIVPDLILENALNGFFGDGATGKDLLMFQLAHAMTYNKRFLGMEVKQGRVLYVNTEDSLKHLRWRQHKIMLHYDLIEGTNDLRIVPMKGQKDTLWAKLGRGGQVITTALYDAMCKLIGEFKPTLVMVANRVNIFSVDQNNDAQARQCLALLDAIVEDYQCTVIMPGHPSLGQLASGTGSSGSVQWSNGCRQRLYLSKPKKNDDDDRPPSEAERNTRILEVLKSNWGPQGDGIRLRWVDWAFKAENEDLMIVPEPGETLADTKQRLHENEIMRAEKEFLRLLVKANKQGVTVCATETARNYAPTLFSRDANCSFKGGKAVLRQAMDNLFEKAVLKSVEYGPPSKRYWRIILVE
jgi:RecA-family ATPase